MLARSERSVSNGTDEERGNLEALTAIIREIAPVN